MRSAVRRNADPAKDCIGRPCAGPSSSPLGTPRGIDLLQLVGQSTTTCMREGGASGSVTSPFSPTKNLSCPTQNIESTQCSTK